MNILFIFVIGIFCSLCVFICFHFHLLFPKGILFLDSVSASTPFPIWSLLDSLFILSNFWTDKACEGMAAREVFSIFILHAQHLALNGTQDRYFEWMENHVYSW